SADRGDRIERANGRRDRCRDADRPHLRASGSHHRSRRGRFHGKEEARGLLLMSARAQETVSEGAALAAATLLGGEGKGLLRFLTCGSVDDGKSTLIGRL